MPSNDHSPGLRSWIADLRDLSAALETAQRDRAAPPRAQLFYHLAPLPSLGGQPALWLKKGNSPEALSVWRPSTQSLRSPPKFITEEDLAILRATLHALPQPTPNPANAWPLPLEPLPPAFLRALVVQLLATRRLIAGDPPVQLVEGPPRPYSPVDINIAFGASPPWYIDLKHRQIGPLSQGASPANPAPNARYRQLDLLPHGELRLETLPSKEGKPETDVACATLCYGEDIRLDFHDNRAFFLLPNGEPVRLKRRLHEEEKLLARLQAFGFKPQQARADGLAAAGFPDPAAATGIYGLPSAEDWESFMRRGRFELEAEGWTVRFPHDFRHHFLEAESWEAELHEGGASANWFALDMGVVVAGQRLSLAPLLADLFTRDPRWLDASYISGLPADAPVDLMTANHARLRVPAGRLKNIAHLLIDLFDNYKGGALRVSRFDAARLEMFADQSPALQWRFSGATSALKLAQKLKDSQGVLPVEPPCGLRISLRDYQKAGLAWLQYLREHELGGILADDMGLGKTAQALAHLLLEKESGRLKKPALIVLPTSLLFNWQSEAARFSPGLRVLSLHGQDRKARFAELSACDIALTTYPLLWRDAADLKAHEYSFLVLDEAQTVKNARGKGAGVVRQLKAEHRLCLTGTPLENHLGELWAQFDFLLPGFLGDARAFARLWRLPIEKNGDSLRRDLLARRVAPFILRRKKEEVAKELPPKNLIVRTVALEGAQRDLYETVRAAMDEKVRAEIARLGLTKSRMVILDALLKLRQVCCDPRLVPFAAAQKVKERAKLQLLMDMLPELVAEGRKVLVFSQFTSMLALIEEEISAAGIHCLLLTGQTQDRETPVRAFQAGQAPVFLISLKAGGLGLNLTAADTVIHYDPWWNPAVETQADDRAHRIGQDKTVFVYKLIVAGSIEEKILALQQEKAQLAAGILSESQSDAIKFSESDIAALLEPLGAAATEKT